MDTALLVDSAAPSAGGIGSRATFHSAGFYL